MCVLYARMKLFPELIGTFKTGLHISKCVSFGENVFNDVWWTIDVNNEEKKHILN